MLNVCHFYFLTADYMFLLMGSTGTERWWHTPFIHPLSEITGACLEFIRVNPPVLISRYSGVRCGAPGKLEPQSRPHFSFYPHSHISCLPGEYNPRPLPLWQIWGLWGCVPTRRGQAGWGQVFHVEHRHTVHYMCLESVHLHDMVQSTIIPHIEDKEE